MTKILFLAGSARKASLHKKLARYACEIANAQGAQTTFIDLADYDMPIYNGDIEEETGLPENAKKLKKIFAQHDAFFIASPEYNSSFSPLLKNAIDWISRPHEENEPRLVAFNGKVAAISSISPGALGGLRGLVPLRMLLGNIGVLVVPTQAAINSGADAFDENGHIKNEMQKGLLTESIQQLTSFSQ